jgi:hypothetical protein
VVLGGRSVEFGGVGGRREGMQGRRRRGSPIRVPPYRAAAPFFSSRLRRWRRLSFSDLRPTTTDGVVAVWLGDGGRNMRAAAIAPAAAASAQSPPLRRDW